MNIDFEVCGEVICNAPNNFYFKKNSHCNIFLICTLDTLDKPVRLLRNEKKYFIPV